MMEPFPTPVDNKTIPNSIISDVRAEAGVLPPVRVLLQAGPLARRRVPVDPAPRRRPVLEEDEGRHHEQVVVPVEDGHAVRRPPLRAGA
eukprot:gene7973-biopygen5876